MNQVLENRFLIDAEEFKAELSACINKAKKRVYVQVMTFERDEVGNWLLDCLGNSQVIDKKLLVDGYSMVNINDGLAFDKRYFSSQSFKNEVKSTRNFLKRKKWKGIEITVTNRIGWNLALYPFRNHKKLIVIDDAIFVGGLNFSEHNFEWHDFMLKIEDREIVEAVAQDIQETKNGINQSKSLSLGSGNRLFFLDGRRSKKVYQELFSVITQAKTSIKIISPYVSNPLLQILKSVKKAKVEILTPRDNNKGIMKKLLLDVASKSNWHLHLYQSGMSHAKAVLIDDSILIVGSSNFDFVSYDLEQEIVLAIQDKQAINEFLERIWDEDVRKSTLHSVSHERYFGARFAIFVAQGFVRFLGNFKRF